MSRASCNQTLLLEAIYIHSDEGVKVIKTNAIIVVLGAIFLLPAPTLAQNYEQGIIGHQTYDSDGIGSVNLSNGNLVLNISLLSYKQRGTLPDYVLSLFANGKNWSRHYYPQSGGTASYYQWVGSGSTGVQLVDSPSYYQTITDYPNQGVTNNLDCVLDECESRWIGDSTGAVHDIAPITGSAILRSPDSSGLMTPGWGSNTVVDRKGNQYVSSCVNQSQQVYYVQDPSGNRITYNTPSGQCSGGNPTDWATSITDSIGRQIPRFTSHQLSQPVGCYTKNYPAWNGATAPLKVCTAQYTTTSDFNDPNVREGAFLFTGISSVELPDHSKWQFGYSSWGELNSITLPTGAVISYVWDTPVTANCAFPCSTGRSVKSRTLTLGSSSYTWQYSYASDPLNDADITTVKDPLNNYSVHTFGLQSMYDTNVKYYDSNNTLLKTVDTRYSSSGGRH